MGAQSALRGEARELSVAVQVAAAAELLMLGVLAFLAVLLPAVLKNGDFDLSGITSVAVPAETQNGVSSDYSQADVAHKGSSAHRL
jgi:hypothetical protein